MARIVPESFIRQNKYRNYVHDVVEATFCSYEINGKKYFQIDTLGKDDRDIKGKVSQTIQIDEVMALYIINLLRKEFDAR